ncbi:MAG: ketosteroid isomerase-like protein [Candidatus Azotimanducaceae bacterium]|jgi:ketosteroid isomerase-like protein
MQVKDLEIYSGAWNAHDIDGIMHYHTVDTIFETGGGAEKFGTRFEGVEIVQARFIEVWSALPDVHFSDGQHFVSGDRGCSEWTFTATTPDGVVIEMNGCDLFTFRDGKIHIKNSLLKNRQ